MLAIRLQRVGKKKQPMYRIVISEKSKDMYGDHLENLGTYNPHTKDIQLKEERIKYWLKTGAQASETVHNLFLKSGIIEGGKKKSVSISNKRKAKIEDVKKKKAEKDAESKAEKENVVEEANITEEKANIEVEKNKE